MVNLTSKKHNANLNVLQSGVVSPFTVDRLGSILVGVHTEVVQVFDGPLFWVEIGCQGGNVANVRIVDVSLKRL